VNFCPLAFIARAAATSRRTNFPGAKWRNFSPRATSTWPASSKLSGPSGRGVAAFAFARVQPLAERMPQLRAAQDSSSQPRSPAANRDWAGAVTNNWSSAGVVRLLTSGRELILK